MRYSGDHGVGFEEERIEGKPRGDEGNAKKEQDGRGGSEY
jgi:hypothetical protein